MIMDSGSRTEFATGAVRDMCGIDKGRCDLVPLDGAAMVFNGNNILSGINRFQETGNTEYLYSVLRLFAHTFNGLADMLLEVSKHFAEGAEKYEEDNWKKGINLRSYVDSALRHYLKYLRGDKDEPHDRAFCWNIMCAIWTCKHKPELNDYGKGAAPDAD